MPGTGLSPGIKYGAKPDRAPEPLSKQSAREPDRNQTHVTMSVRWPRVRSYEGRSTELRRAGGGSPGTAS